tara:strand:+ start:389 stop:523 length:135 start_codon:yes stop_codon:yes gene_type:complete
VGWSLLFFFVQYAQQELILGASAWGRKLYKSGGEQLLIIKKATP